MKRLPTILEEFIDLFATKLDEIGVSWGFFTTPHHWNSVVGDDWDKWKNKTIWLAKAGVYWLEESNKRISQPFLYQEDRIEGTGTCGINDYTINYSHPFYAKNDDHDPERSKAYHMLQSLIKSKSFPIN
ncbi:unnamed protein product [Cylicocyclus nassatus]|uniref:Uncharacterized protein n=1 Tax=Cylicocyclus nassatus TaxID=53992 RepID=A0AA36MDC8_CYLNA|nr:unnamed protein product [Cylicocyclus nassatus]